MKLDQVFFRQNRARLGEQLKGGLIVLSAYELMQSSADMTADFIQEANFWYLSGIDAARWRIVYDANRNHTWLVRPALSEIERIFNGQTDDTDALRRGGADDVIAADEFEGLLRQLARKHTIAYTVMPQQHEESFVLNPSEKNLTMVLKRIFADVVDCRRELTRLRAIKQPVEIAAMKKAAKLTCQTFAEIKTRLAEYNYEYEIEADFTAAFRRKNARHAYEPIVAAGMNATTLHYVENAAKVSAHDLVLIDIGSSVDGYASDVTRTYSLRQSSARQKMVHGAVVQAQQKIIALLRPGLSTTEYHRDVDRIMYEACQSLGLEAGSEIETVHRYMPHAVSHGLGIDVHDALGGPSQFKEGMVLTVEPGIYIPNEKIGVRIEDDILITAKGHQNLTGNLSTDL